MSSNDLDIVNVLEDLENAKSQLRDGLKDIRVFVDGGKHPEILSSIRSLFSDIEIKDNKAYITFDMIVQCTRLMHKAGMYKAGELIK